MGTQRPARGGCAFAATIPPMTDADLSTQDAASPPQVPPQAEPAGWSARATVLFVVVTLLVLGADLALKYVSFSTGLVAGSPSYLDPQQPDQPLIPAHEPMTIVPGVLSLRLTTNTGAVFGLGSGGRWVFVIVSIIACAVILRLFWRSPAGARGLHVALALILAGALGNLYDRLRYSAVRDMLYLFPERHLPFGLAWPGGDTRVYPWVFNIADVALILGVALVVLLTWWRERPARGLRSDRG